MGKVLPPKGFEPKFTRHWFLVANRAEACIYEGNLGKELHFLKRLLNPRSRLTELELVADKPGRRFSSSRSGVRHGLEPRTNYHEVVAVEFARRIGKELDRALLQKQFTDLVVVAEPHFLGLLKLAFTPRTKEKIRHTIAREWHEGSDRELEKYLQSKLA